MKFQGYLLVTSASTAYDKGDYFRIFIHLNNRCQKYKRHKMTKVLS